MQKIMMFAFIAVLITAFFEKKDTINFSVDYFYDDVTDEREAYHTKVGVYIERNLNSKNQSLPFNLLIKGNDNISIVYKDDISYLIDENNKEIRIGYYDSLNYVLGIDGTYLQEMIVEMMNNTVDSIKINVPKDSIVTLSNTNNKVEEFYFYQNEIYYDEYQVNLIERNLISIQDELPRKIEILQIKGSDSLKRIYNFTIHDKGFKFDKSKLSMDFAKDYSQEVIQPKPRPLGVGELAPDFELVNHMGKTVKLSDYRGKVVLIEFWAVWCSWCVKSFSKLEAAYEALKGKKVEFLGISCQEPEDADPVKFAREKGITYPILLKGDEVAQSFKVEGYPTFYIIDTEGNIVLYQSGYYETLDKIIINEVNKIFQ